MKLENCCRGKAAGRTGGGDQDGRYTKSNFRSGGNRVWSKTQILMCREVGKEDWLTQGLKEEYRSEEINEVRGGRSE